MFKVTTIRERPNLVTLRLEGRLLTAWVEECARAVTAAMADGSSVILDLDGLTFIDDEGVAAIRTAVGSGAELAGGSQFIAALIGEARSR